MKLMISATAKALTPNNLSWRDTRGENLATLNNNKFGNILHAVSVSLEKFPKT